MTIYRASARRRAPAAKLLLAACGLAGCTGGPAISSVSADPPSSLARSEQRALEAGDTAGRARIATIWPKLSARTIWGSRKHKVEPVNPFGTAGVAQAAGEETDEAVMPPAPATTRVADGGAQASPSGVATARDNRLPPASPLGGRRSAARTERPGMARISSSVDQDDAPVDATPVRPGVPVRSGTPVWNATTARNSTSGRRTTAKPAARTTPKATIPLDEFLVDGERTRGIGRGQLQHEDMIVDSAILPKREDWRGEAAVRTADDRANFPITPRRPFSSPDWEPVATAPAASANLPVTLSPTERIEAEPVSVAKVMPAPVELPMAAPIGTAVAPPAEPEAENPFLSTSAPAVAEPIRAAAEEQQPTLTAGPMLAPGVSSGGGLTVPAGPALGGPALAMTTARPETPPTRLVEATVEARPVDLAEAKQLAEREAVRPRAGLSTPLAVGLALAVVAIGAVMIRRRFA